MFLPAHFVMPEKTEQYVDLNWMGTLDDSSSLFENDITKMFFPQMSFKLQTKHSCLLYKLLWLPPVEEVKIGWWQQIILFLWAFENVFIKHFTTVLLFIQPHWPNKRVLIFTFRWLKTVVTLYVAKAINSSAISSQSFYMWDDKIRAGGKR